MFGWVDITEKIAEGRLLHCLPNSDLAHVHLAWNNLDAARSFADRGVELGRRAVMPGFFESARSLALVQAQKDWEVAIRAARDIDSLSMSYGFSGLHTGSCGR
jgi:tetratricopeptide repeat protein